MTQAVVEGPIGEEAAVLGAAGRNIFRWLWWQRRGARGLGQGLVACGGGGHRPRLETLGAPFSPPSSPPTCPGALLPASPQQSLLCALGSSR